MNHRTVRALVGIAALLVVGCSKNSEGASAADTSGASSSSATASGSSAPSSDGHSKIEPYPAWAAAVAPNYTGRVLSAGGLSGRLYQIDSADDYETVLAWYKSHVKTNWPAGDPDTPQDQTITTVGKVQITVQKNSYANSPAQPKTMIALSLR